MLKKVDDICVELAGMKNKECGFPNTIEEIVYQNNEA